jgi:hypothetical protein
VLVASANRLALMRELRGAPEPSLADLLRLLAPVDLVLVEGFKRDSLPKIEVHRAANGKPPIHPQDDCIVALISDCLDPPGHLPHASIDDIAAAADLVLAHAAPIACCSRAARAFVGGGGSPGKTARLPFASIIRRCDNAVAPGRDNRTEG